MIQKKLGENLNSKPRKWVDKGKTAVNVKKFTSEVKYLAAEKRYIKYCSNKIEEEEQEYAALKNRVHSKIAQIKRDQ